MFKKSLVLILVLALVLSMGLTGCAKKTAGTADQTQTADQIAQAGQKDANNVTTQQNNTTPNPVKAMPDRADTLIVGEEEAKGQFFSLYSTTSYDTWMSNLLEAGLVNKAKDQSYVPWLAESYDVSDDKLTYTFHLRPDLKFSDGTLLTAQDVEFTYLCMADPGYTGRYTSVVQDIVGFEAYFNDKDGKVTSMEGIKVIDDKTISFTFTKAVRTNITNFTMGILPKAKLTFTKGKADEVLVPAMAAPVGAGPYKLVKFEPSQFVEMDINENFFGTKPKIKKVIYKMVQDATNIQELIAGNIDILPGMIEPEKLEMAKAAGFINLAQYPRSGYGYIAFNCTEAPTNDVLVRQALIYGYDRQSFVNLYFKGLAVPQDVTMSQVSWAYTKTLQDKLIHYAYDPEKAKSLLEQAGWKVGADGIREKDGQKLKVHWLAIKDQDLANTMIPILTENWKAIGVQLEVELLDFNSIIAKIYDERTGFNMYNLGSSWPTADPDTAYQSYVGKFDVPGGDNNSHYHNARVDELMEAARLEFDIQKAIPMYEEVFAILNQEVPDFVNYANLYTDLYNNRVKNYNPNSLWDWTNAIFELELEQ